MKWSGLIPFITRRLLSLGPLYKRPVYFRVAYPPEYDEREPGYSRLHYSYLQYGKLFYGALRFALEEKSKTIRLSSGMIRKPEPGSFVNTPRFADMA